MPNSNAGDIAKQNCYDVEKNAGLALKIFAAYYREHNHSGKIYDDLPDFFLVKPWCWKAKDLATKSSEKLLLEDCIQRAKARKRLR